MPLAIINFLDQHGRPVDPGYGQGHPSNYPSTGPIYGGGYPSTGPVYPGGHPGGGPVYPSAPVDPGWGIPEGARPDNGLPAPPEVTPSPPHGEHGNKIIVAVYRPNQGWTCRMYDPGVHPDHGLPGGGNYPSQGLPGQPGHPSTGQPPNYPSGQPVPPGYPTTGPVPGQPPMAGQPLPPTAQPRR
jgi:hypothetical protein